MQILIDFAATNEGIIHSNEKAKKDWERFRLLELLKKLESDGYKINSLYGRFIFDEAKKEAIDLGEAGVEVRACMNLVDSVFATNGKMAVIFTDKKYIVFCNRYFLAIHFCHMRKVAPISIYSVLENYEGLIKKESNELLSSLYFEAFELRNGKGHEAVSCFANDTKLRTKGYGVPAPLEERKKEKIHLCLIMPDGSTLGLPIYEGENTKEEIEKFKVNWKKVTFENPKLFDHKISKRKCPKCGGEIHYKNGTDLKFSWCTKCDYQTSEEKKK